MATEINPLQQMQIELIRNFQANLYDGEQVGDDLVANRVLWRGVLMDRLGSRSDLIKLRDLELGIWNVDTLYILSSRIDDAALEALAGTWQADEIAWIEGEEARTVLGGGGLNNRILQVWWD